MYISEKDKELMYSLYMKDKTFTHENIASLFGNKYEGINKGIVGYIVREMNEATAPLIDFENTKERVISFVKTDIQAGRKSTFA